MSATWSEIRAGWSSAWTEMEKTAYATYGRAIEREPMRYAGEAESFLRNLQVARTSLTVAFAHLELLRATDAAQHALFLPKFQAQQARYNALAAGVWANSTLGDAAPETGALPAAAVVAVVLGVGLTAVGVAWAVAYREYAVAAKKETALLAEELRARVAATQQGHTLPPATIDRVPPPTPPSLPSPSGGGGSGATLLLGGLLLAAAVGGGALYLRTR